MTLLLCPVVARAAETGTPQIADGTGVDAAVVRSDSALTPTEALLERGRASLRAYRADQVANSDQLVSAARDFRAAIALLHTQQDPDQLAEAESCLYWCKKQMNLVQLRAFVAQPDVTNPPPAKAATATVASVVEPAPAEPRAPISEAPPALNTPATLFTRLAQPPGQRLAPPGEGRFSRLREQVRTSHGAAYQRTAVAAKRVLSRLLISDSDQPAAPSDLRYALLQEALRLAIETEDLPVICSATSRIGTVFSGPAGGTLLRQYLPRLLEPRLRQAISQLLGDPHEPHANAVIGRELCGDQQSWDLGLPLLANGDDARVAALAVADLATPTAPAEIRTLADRWYALAREQPQAELRCGMLSRAASWYRLLVHDTAATARVDEIEQALPLDLERLSWSKLSGTTWERLPGKLLYVPCERDRIGPVSLLRPGERIRVVPHPQETWVLADGRTSTASGLPPSNADQSPYPDFPTGCLLQQVDTAAPARCGEVAGPGALFLIPNRSSGANYGGIRVKLVPLDAPAP